MCANFILPCGENHYGFFLRCPTSLCNQPKLSFYIFNEIQNKHHREHFHAFLNDEKVASIYLDNFEIDYLNSKVKSKDKKEIEFWVQKHIDDLQKIKFDENGKFEIPFLGMRESDLHG